MKMIDEIKEKSKELIKLIPSKPLFLSLEEALLLYKYLNILERKIDCVLFRLNEKILEEVRNE